MTRRFLGALTVEASLIIGLSLLVFGATVVMAYDTFYESLEYVSNQYEDVDAISIFKMSEGFRRMLGK